MKVPPPISKRQQKKVLKQVKWEAKKIEIKELKKLSETKHKKPKSSFAHISRFNTTT